MSSFDWLKLVHVSCAVLSVCGFALRGYWCVVGNPLGQTRLAKILPHLVDTLLLSSAVGMLVVWQLSPLQLGWLTAKLVALLLYIGLGIVMMRFAQGGVQRLAAYLMALATAGYIISVAYTKSALGILAALGG